MKPTKAMLKRRENLDDADRSIDEAVRWLSSAQTKIRDGARALAMEDIGYARDKIHDAEMLMLPKAEATEVRR